MKEFHQLHFHMQGDLLPLVDTLDGAQDGRCVGRKLVAVRDRGDQTRCHPLTQLIPEAQLDVHRPAGVGAADGGVGAVGEVTHAYALNPGPL